MEQELLTGLEEALLQLEYLSSKFGETGSGNSTISRTKALIAKAHKADTLEVLLEKLPAHIVLRRDNTAGTKWMCFNVSTREYLRVTIEDTPHAAAQNYFRIYVDREAQAH